MTPSMEAVRAALLTRLAAVSGIGKVHNRVRFYDRQAALQDIAVSGSRLHVWFVTTAAAPVNTARLTGLSLKQRVYHYVLRGFYALDDAGSSEVAFATVCEAVLDKFLAEDGRKLPEVTGVICVGMDEDGGLNWVEGGGEQATMYPAVEGGALCHYARIAVPVRVQIL